MNRKEINSMKRLVLGAVVIVLALIGITGYARSVRGGNLSSLCERLDRGSSYRVERNAGVLHLIDRVSEKELCLVRDDGAESLVVSSTIAHIDLSNASLAEQTRRTISFYNLNLSVGTLMLDENTGVVSMIYYASPRSTSLNEIVQAIDHFTNVARTAAGEFSAMPIARLQ